MLEGEWNSEWTATRFCAFVLTVAACNVVAVTEWSFKRITRRVNYTMIVATVVLVCAAGVEKDVGYEQAFLALVVTVVVTGLYSVGGRFGSIGGGDVRCICWVTGMVSGFAGLEGVWWLIAAANLAALCFVGGVWAKEVAAGGQRERWLSRRVAFGPWLCVAAVGVLGSGI